ncbi:MAG: transcription/translation regulatory transformer protein RfaH [Gallionellaceae bacterium]|jgi:transcriptional antiterminator RfaH
MRWYVIYTKPRQEQRALLNLDQQGYECYLPLITIEKLHRSKLSLVDEPLFARYLFIHLNTGQAGKSWGPIRSTKGVSRLVAFGAEPAVVDDQLIHILQARESLLLTQPQRLFESGERVLVTGGPFAGLEAIYQISDGESRAMVLIELLSKFSRLNIPAASLRKIS